MFAGPGEGIVASGLIASAMVAWRMTSADAWLVFGLLAAVLTASVWRVFAPSAAADRPAVAATSAATPIAAGAIAAPHGRIEVATLAFAYGAYSGFGYIVTATFLPVIARSSLPPASPWLDLFWPIFGVGVIVGALLATRVRIGGDLRLVIASCYVLQAIAIAVGIGVPTAAGFAVGSFLLGLPFTAITFFALQEVRRLRPLQIASTTGLLTVLWSIGQAAGPPMVALLLRRGGTVDAAFTLALAIAAAGARRRRGSRSCSRLASGAGPRPKAAGALIDASPARLATRRVTSRSLPSEPVLRLRELPRVFARGEQALAQAFRWAIAARVVASAQEHARLPARVAPGFDNRRGPVAMIRPPSSDMAASRPPKRALAFEPKREPTRPEPSLR